MGLNSRSNLQFRVRQSDLRAGSGVFRDMLEVGTGAGMDVVPLTEPSEVLEAVLFFCTPSSAYKFEVGDKLVWAICNAFDKYDVSQDGVRVLL
jgi:hypothetical protein